MRSDFCLNCCAWTCVRFPFDAGREVLYVCMVSTFALENLVARKTGSAVPSLVSPFILHTQHQAESGAYSRASLFPPAFREGVHLL